MTIEIFDSRRDVVILNDNTEAIDFAVEHFIHAANVAIKDHGFFSVALSGGSTPKAIFKKLCDKENADKIDFTKVLLFWGDERTVPLDDSESNYKMAMDAGFKSLVPENHIFPMIGTGDLELNAKAYDALIKSKIPTSQFDYVMLGMGDDGHTASLFPHTTALHIADKLVVANDVPQKNTSRLTLTYDCINNAKQIVIYVLGKSKATMLNTVLNSPFMPDELPIQKIGTASSKALFILDKDAASEFS